MFFAAAVLILTATPDDPLASGRGYIEERPGPLRLGLSAAVALGPRWLTTDELVFLGELAALLELNADYTSFRFGLGFRVGMKRYGAIVGGSAWADFLALPTPRFGVGLTIEGGVFAYVNEYVVGTVAPGLTLGAVRLGVRRQHELSLVASVTFTTDVPPGMRGLLRYVYLF